MGTEILVQVVAAVAGSLEQNQFWAGIQSKFIFGTYNLIIRRDKEILKTTPD